MTNETLREGGDSVVPVSSRTAATANAAPKRIQRKRTKGWRMPENAVYVGRPTQWGNPFTVVEGNHGGWRVEGPKGRIVKEGMPWRSAVSVAVREYMALVMAHNNWEAWVGTLRGKDLACWCPLDQPCHADVLIELANAKGEGR